MGDSEVLGLEQDDLIENFVPHRHPPSWDALSSRKLCSHCGDKLRVFRKHNCRLCGAVFCGPCTGKYNVPSAFRLKGKKGPVRVCFGCRDQCLEHRATITGVEISLRPRRQMSKVEGVSVLTPPTWVLIPDAKLCFECASPISLNAFHHCRLCGHGFCSGCCCKEPLQIPAVFRRKCKPGPVRVCYECRYLARGGAILKATVPTRSPASMAATLPPRRFDRSQSVAAGIALPAAHEAATRARLSSFVHQGSMSSNMHRSTSMSPAQSNSPAGSVRSRNSSVGRRSPLPAAMMPRRKSMGGPAPRRPGALRPRIYGAATPGMTPGGPESSESSDDGDDEPVDPGYRPPPPPPSATVGHSSRPMTPGTDQRTLQQLLQQFSDSGANVTPGGPDSATRGPPPPPPMGAHQTVRTNTPEPLARARAISAMQAHGSQKTLWRTPPIPNRPLMTVGTPESPSRTPPPNGGSHLDAPDGPEGQPRARVPLTRGPSEPPSVPILASHARILEMQQHYLDERVQSLRMKFHNARTSIATLTERQSQLENAVGSLSPTGRDPEGAPPAVVSSQGQRGPPPTPLAGGGLSGASSPTSSAAPGGPDSPVPAVRPPAARRPPPTPQQQRRMSEQMTSATAAIQKLQAQPPPQLPEADAPTEDLEDSSEDESGPSPLVSPTTKTRRRLAGTVGRSGFSYLG